MKTAWSERNGGIVSVEVVTEAIDRIVKKHGVCPPSMLVDGARPESSPLHPLFEWDDSIAAESWRTQQARVIIRAVVLLTDNDKPTVNAYVHVTSAEGVDGYIGSVYAMSDTAMAAQVLGDAVKLLIGIQKRYAGLKALGPVWDALDRVRQEVKEKEKTAV